MVKNIILKQRSQGIENISLFVKDGKVREEDMRNAIDYNDDEVR